MLKSLDDACLHCHSMVEHTGCPETSDASEYNAWKDVGCRYLNLLMRKQTMWFQNRSDTNQAVQSQKQARSLKFSD